MRSLLLMSMLLLAAPNEGSPLSVFDYGYCPACNAEGPLKLGCDTCPLCGGLIRGYDPQAETLPEGVRTWKASDYPTVVSIGPNPKGEPEEVGVDYAEAPKSKRVTIKVEYKHGKNDTATSTMTCSAPDAKTAKAKIKSMRRKGYVILFYSFTDSDGRTFYTFDWRS